MSPVKHPVTGPTLTFSLHDEIRIVREQLARSGERSGRTLMKDGPLRATLIGLNAGGSLRPHRAEGPLTVQVLEGTIEFEVAGESWTLSMGTLFALDAGIVHSVTSADGAIFLLTVVTIQAAPVASASDAIAAETIHTP
jgi:quercetin dioxygenase-like cupin family protein